MVPPVQCNHCGFAFRSAFAFQGSQGTVHLSGNFESCPRCGEMCATPNGVFQLGDELKRAIRQPGVTRDQLIAFQKAAVAVNTGKKTADEAASFVAEFNSNFAMILQLANHNAQALGLLIGILSLFLACYTIWDSSLDSEQAHADARAQLEMTEKLIEAIGSEKDEDKATSETLREIDLKIENLNTLYSNLAASQTSEKLTIQSYQKQKPSSNIARNRHERRKAARLAKRNR